MLGLEQFELGHANGASADHSRIIRLSYHRPDYVRLAKRAYETWAEVEAEAGERIVTVTGGLDLWPADPAIPMADYTDSLTAEGSRSSCSTPPRSCAAGRSGASTTSIRAMCQAQGGLADPFRGNAAHRRLARANGATLRDRTPGDGASAMRAAATSRCDAGRRRTGPGGSSSPPTPGRTSCWPRSTGACR